MTKQYPIIELNSFLYAVNKDITLNVSEFYPNLDSIRNVIIGSSNPALSTLPSLPEIEEDIEELARNNNSPLLGYDGDKGIAGKIFTCAIKNFKDGYRAASKNKYSEEEAFGALVIAIELWQLKSDDGNLKILYDTFKETLKTIDMAPKPIAIEVEMKFKEAFGAIDCSDPDDGPYGSYYPKVDKDNKILGRYIYE